ncbi:hypothetical protein GWK48_06290 [Metallosphaera tengchongensis]|uniref:Uncharacterized protein n=1 Tax=Metallosphaera tengchongensis TaxID=1532350 RepID=A0A6N0NXD4_9CREN|nr:hypothetical protein [Metallosphaera tengchongensis]QKR00038.1 hypothetical protein GWK48_06290 [Metallosphaera tengchongensis]
MSTIRVIFGLNGDRGILPVIYEVTRSTGFKDKFNIKVDVDLLYDSLYPSIEIDGVKVTFDYLSDEDAREQVKRLIKGELPTQRSPKVSSPRDDRIFSDGVLAS